MQNVEFSKQTSPYVRKEVSTKRMMFDVLIALTPVVVFAIYRFGMNAVTRILISAVTFVLVEAIWFFFLEKSDKPTLFGKIKDRYAKFSINNVSAPLVSGLIYSLLLPDQLNLYVVFIGAFLGVSLGKMIFGGLGHNVFNPAALGRVIIGLSFASFFQGSYGFVDAVAGATPLSINFTNLFDFYTLTDLLTGNIPGSMGEINAVLILAGGAYLFIRRSGDFRPALSALLIFTILITITAIFYHPNLVLEYVLFHLLSGGLLFGLVFMITDPVTSPVTRPGRWIYGLIVGVLIYAIRIFGLLPEGVAFSLLIANLFVPLIDYPRWANNKYTLKFLISYVVSIVILGLIVGLIVGGVI